MSYRFRGFSSPNYTQTPNELFDELLPQLSESELKVLLYVIRRTFGFGKDHDAISINQLAEGITTKDGRRLDAGTGLSRTSVKKATAALVDKGVLTVRKIRSDEGDYESNVFSLRFLEVGQNVAYPRSESAPPVGQNLPPQEKDVQERREQDFESSKGPTLLERYDETRLTLLAYAEDLAREFRDEAPLSSTTTRLVNLYRAAGVDLETFVDRMMQARAITQERTSAIRKRGDDGRGLAQKMPYFLAVLQDILGQGDGASRNAGD